MLTLREVLVGTICGYDGVEGGICGPRNIPANRVRNTAHWLINFAWYYKHTLQPSLQEQVEQFAQFLISEEARPAGYAFYNLPEHHSPGNGLIGQVWIMEALLTASETLGEPRFAQVAAEVFEQHAFDETQSLWRILHPNGSIQHVHPTLNQQVWFAAMGARLAPFGATNAEARVAQFLNRLSSHIHLLSGGLLGMRIRKPPSSLSWKERLLKMRRWMRTRLMPNQLPSFTYRETSVGYHAFAMYGFALLYESFPNHPFWQSPQFQRALRWTYSDMHQRALQHNRFAMGYNPSGFEVPYVLSVFRPIPEAEMLAQSRWWLGEQIRRHYDPATGKFSRNTYDEPTLTARVYEATRLPDALLDLPLDYGTRNGDAS